MNSMYHPCDIKDKINDACLLVVGAGGIGCEVLKNLVLTGFKNIEIIDLDTIDLSNLNRQFLFQRNHVGQSKALVAKETALKFEPSANIISHHGSIMSPEYGVTFFKKFSLVINALDNRAARNHVNRLCLAADVPLLESGTAGYIGQSTVIKKNQYKCYECDLKAPQKSYPGCTIRNTPSEPIHCVVWAKHLFNQLFGEADPDEDVSPDAADPEAAVAENGNVERLSTRTWAMSTNYNPEKVFHKLFNEDIKYLLSMEKLWKKRRPPTPLEWNKLPDAVAGSSKNDIVVGLQDQRILSVKQYCDSFSESCNKLAEQMKRLQPGDHLVWDKDDHWSMIFVTACANIRAHIFNIPIKSQFDIKSMAGNIIPAIATTNAVIAGLLVLECLKVLSGYWSHCRTTYLNKRPINKKLIVPAMLEPPVSKCIVCSERPEVSIRVNVKKFTFKSLEEKVLKGTLNMIAPDVEVDGRGIILISSEEGETTDNMNRSLEDMQVLDGTVLKCDDFMQEYSLWVTVMHSDEIIDGEDFEMVGELSLLNHPKAETGEEKAEKSVSNGNNDIHNVDDDDITEILDDGEIMETSNKRRHSDAENDVVAKRARTDEVIVI